MFVYINIHTCTCVIVYKFICLYKYLKNKCNSDMLESRNLFQALRYSEGFNIIPLAKFKIFRSSYEGCKVNYFARAVPWAEYQRRNYFYCIWRGKFEKKNVWGILRWSHGYRSSISNEQFALNMRKDFLEIKRWNSIKRFLFS